MGQLTPSGSRRRRRLRWAFACLLLAAASITGCSATYNALTDPATAPPRALSKGPFVEAAGVLTRYQRWGRKGSPIVLVGGFLEPTSVWERVAPLLARQHRVYALDLAGFGYSERVGTFSLAAWSDQLRAFLRELSIERPILVGHSLGAGVVAEVARQNPELVRGIVLADGDARRGGAGVPGWVRDLLVDPFRTSLIRLALGSDLVVRSVLHEVYGPHRPPIDARELDRWRRPFRVEGTEQALAVMASREIPGLDLGEIGQITTPAMLIWGDHDSSVSLASGRTTAAALHAPITIVPGGGHLAMLTDPVPFAAAIDRFASAQR